MGANGAGKSTLARILAGLLLRDSGKITFLGQPHDPHSRRQSTATARVIERLAVKCDSAEQPVNTLRGASQQKIVIGRCLLPNSKVLLLDEPTRGVDVPTKEAIYKLLRELVFGRHTAMILCHRSLQNQPVRVESKPATLKGFIHVCFPDLRKCFFVLLT